ESRAGPAPYGTGPQSIPILPGKDQSTAVPLAAAVQRALRLAHSLIKETQLPVTVRAAERIRRERIPVADFFVIAGLPACRAEQCADLIRHLARAADALAPRRVVQPASPHRTRPIQD